MKRILSMILFVLITGTLLTSLLIIVDRLTGPRIEKNVRLKTLTAVLSGFSLPADAETAEDVFTERISTESNAGLSWYRSADGRRGFIIDGAGLWGPIRAVLVLSPDLSSVDGMTIIHQEETPGLGGRISEPDFLAKFKGKSVSPLLVIAKAGSAVEKNEVDGITGATLSGNALQEIINNQIVRYTAAIRGVQP